MGNEYCHAKKLRCTLLMIVPCLLAMYRIQPMALYKPRLPQSNPAIFMQQVDRTAEKIFPIITYVMCVTILMHSFMFRETAVTTREKIKAGVYQLTTAFIQQQKNREYKNAIHKTLPEISHILYRIPHGKVANSNARDVAPIISSFLFGQNLKNYSLYTRERIAAWNSTEAQADRAASAELFHQNFPLYICNIAQFLWYAFAIRTALASINRIVVQPLDRITQSVEHGAETPSYDPSEPEKNPDDSEEPLIMLAQITLFFFMWNRSLQQQFQLPDIQPGEDFV